MTPRRGRHFLQIPGPSNVPDRVLRAMDRPVIDHRGPEFAELALGLLDKLRQVFRTAGAVLVFPASGSGGWEAALVNTTSPGDRVVFFDHGFFAGKWADVAAGMGLDVEPVPGDWRRPVEPGEVEAVLRADADQRIRAVCVVHNETSTGVTTAIPPIRDVLDETGHPALLMVDAVSSVGSVDYRHQEWGVDVTVAGAQKGLMMPPGLGLNAVSDRALEARRSAAMPRSYWDWGPMLEANRDGFFPYTPATNLLQGLDEALEMLLEEGLPGVFRRHHRLAEATRRAVAAWDLETCCAVPTAHSDTVTTVLAPEGSDADELRRVILDRFDMSLGTGLGKLSGRAFRIGHLGDFNELMLMGTLCGVEMGLGAAGVPHTPGGVTAALEYLAEDG